MDKIREIADKADMIVNGYAFTRENVNCGQTIIMIWNYRRNALSVLYIFNKTRVE